VVESSRWDWGSQDRGLDQQMAAHDGLVHWVVRQQWRGDLAFDEAVHAGRLGLWHALGGYDPSRGNRFSTYAVPAITHAVWDAVATHAQGMQPGEPRLLGALVDEPDLDTRLDRVQRAVALRASVGELPARLRQVIVAHYGLDQTAPQSFAQIGRRLGISRQRVQQLHLMALRWLAHPAHSRRLRRLLDRQQRGDYQQALAHQRAGARVRRGRGRTRR
jgi:RNA polymerase sigma factor (sigma-70 family)